MLVYADVLHDNHHDMSHTEKALFITISTKWHLTLHNCQTQWMILAQREIMRSALRTDIFRGCSKCRWMENSRYNSMEKSNKPCHYRLFLRWQHITLAILHSYWQWRQLLIDSSHQAFCAMHKTEVKGAVCCVPLQRAYANYLTAAVVNQLNWPPAIVLDPDEYNSCNVAGS